ncbi:hypothetical protein VPH35_117667 [Triticum aestivum]
MGTSASSLLDGHAARRRGYERIPRHDEGLKEEEEEHMSIPRHDEGEKEEHTSIPRHDEERQGPAALEARGRMLRNRARCQATVFATWKDLRDSALCYLLALNWREAALGFGQQARYELRRGDERRAATALLRSAKCYDEIEDKREDVVAYVKQALEEATTLFDRTGERRLAAGSCEELAEFYMDQQDLRGALGAFQRAAGYCTCDGVRGHLELKADAVRFLLRDEEALRRQGVLPFEDYKRRTAGYIRSSDPDWHSKVSKLYNSTFHDSVHRAADLVALKKEATTG